MPDLAGAKIAYFGFTGHLESQGVTRIAAAMNCGGSFCSGARALLLIACHVYDPSYIIPEFRRDECTATSINP